MEMTAPKKMQGWLVLFLVALVAGLALAATNEMTREPIKQRAIESALAARKAVFSAADAFEELPVATDSGVDSFYRALKDGQTIGYEAQSTVHGYGGPIEVIVGMDMDSKLTAISVGGSNFAETAGLGSKAKEPAFKDQFAGITLPAELNGNVDAISGATITSRAVVLGVNQAGQYILTSMSDGSLDSVPDAGAAQSEGETGGTEK